MTSAIAKAAETALLDDWTAFAKATKLKAAQLKKIRPFITEKDASTQPIDGEPDVDLRDTENTHSPMRAALMPSCRMKC